MLPVKHMLTFYQHLFWSQAHPPAICFFTVKCAVFFIHSANRCVVDAGYYMGDISSNVIMIIY